MKPIIDAIFVYALVVLVVAVTVLRIWIALRDLVLPH